MMFPGLADGNPLIQVVMEKQILVARAYIEGKITLPYFEDMLRSLKEEKEQCCKVGLRKFYKASVNFQWRYISKLHELLHKESKFSLPLNTKYNDVLKEMIEIFRETVTNGNFISFKEYDYSSLIPDDFEYDTTEYF